MRRIVIYIVILALSLMIPEYGTDVGKLIPVEVVLLYKEEEQLILETDTGLWGSGETTEEAIRDLRESAPGTVFLDTAEYLLIDESARDRITEMGAHLKGSVGVCMAQRGVDLHLAAQYLDVHPPEMKLKEAENSEVWQELKQKEEK